MLAVSGCSAQEDGTDNPVAAEVSSLSATAGDTSVTLQWKDPSPDTFEMIEITHTPGGSVPVTVAKGVETATITGLANRQLHEFTVTAVDQKGWRSSGVKISARPFPATVTLEISYEYGSNMTPTNYSNIYVIWIENNALNFLQNLKICNRLLPDVSNTLPLSGTALPFWKMNRYGSSDADEVDAVTSATIANADFTVTQVLKDITKHQFTVYFETDRSYDNNSWFNDQPALLYSAAVDLDSTVSEYELTPHGWTPNAETENVIPSTPAGALQRELRYITHGKAGDGSFGAADARSATSMVKRIILRIK